MQSTDLFMFREFMSLQVPLSCELGTTLVTGVPHSVMLRQLVSGWFALVKIVSYMKVEEQDVIFSIF